VIWQPSLFSASQRQLHFLAVALESAAADAAAMVLTMLALCFGYGNTPDFGATFQGLPRKQVGLFSSNWLRSVAGSWSLSSSMVTLVLEWSNVQKTKER
jgi:hypothetical protein